MKLLEVNEGSQAPHATSMSALADVTNINSGNPVTPFQTLATSNQNLENTSSRKNRTLPNLSINHLNNSSSAKSMASVSNDIRYPQLPCRPKRERTESESLFMNGDDLLLDISESSHSGLVLSGINSLRRQSQFCDINLVVEEHEYPAHRAVLATCSPHLFDILTNFEESAEQQFSCKLKDISHVGFEYVLDFMYTGRLQVPACDVPIVYTTSLILKMESAVRACATFLAEHLTADNCLEIRRLVKDDFITAAVDAFIRQHVDEVMASQSFVGLKDLQMELVGFDEDITNETMERRLFTLVMDWAKSNLNDLKPKIERLTEQVNVLYLDSDNTLRDVAEMGDTPSSDDDMVADYKIMARRRTKATTKAALTTHNNISNGNGAQPFQKFALNPEEAVSVAEREWSIVATRKTNENVYFAITLLDGHLLAISVHLRPPTSPSDTASGSGSGPNSPSIATQFMSAGNGQLSPFVRKTSIALLEGMSTPRCAMGAVALGGEHLVVCGGYDRGECLSSVESFSVSQGKWTQMTEMNRARGRFSATQLDGFIFVCGGSDGWQELSCVERYDPTTQKWKYMASMLKEKSSHGVVALNGKLYSVGGCDGQRSLAECEVYDPANNRWSKIASLNMARSQTSVCAVNGLIFAIGGTDLWNTLNTVEVYDPVEDEWTVHSQLHIARRGAGVDIVDGSIVVVGGSDGAQSLVSTEIFSPTKADNWTLGPSLTTQRANLSAVTVNSRLFAVGGFSGKKFLNTLEWLDLDGGEWFGHAPRSDAGSDRSEGESEDGASAGENGAIIS